MLHDSISVVEKSPIPHNLHFLFPFLPSLNYSHGEGYNLSYKSRKGGKYVVTIHSMGKPTNKTELVFTNFSPTSTRRINLLSPFVSNPVFCFTIFSISFFVCSEYVLSRASLTKS